MDVTLTPELHHFVQTELASGRYTSANEVIKEALHLLEEHNQTRTAQLEAFNQELDRRIASLDRGEFVTPEELKASIRQLSAEYRQRSA